MDIRRLLDHDRLDQSFPLDPGRPFRTSDAAREGLSRWHLEQLTRAGLLRRTVRGVYVGARTPDTLEVRLDSLRLVVPDDYVVVDRHAGWVHGAQMILAPGEHLHTRPVSIYRTIAGGRLRNPIAASGERALTLSDISEIGGVRVTTPLRTALDLGMVRDPADAISGLDAMLRAGVDREALLLSIPRFRGRRWVTTLRAMAPLADGRAESPPESVLRLRCHEADLNDMVPQIEVRRDGLLIARLDLGDEERKAAVEYDGAEWHGSAEQQEHDRSRRAEVVDEDWLVEVFVCADVYGRARTVDDRLAAFARRLHGRGGRSVA